jgi:L-lactate dehydrogenase complex protein LldF
VSTFIGMPRGTGQLQGTRTFPEAAHDTLQDAQLRRNLGHALATIRARRLKAVGELPDWEQLRDAGSQIKANVMARLPEYLEQLEAAVVARGGRVHWARDSGEANRIVADLIRATGSKEVIKVKSMATEEIGLNEHLATEGISAIETDLAELIVQLGHDKPSHILVPAIHKNRSEIREIFLREMPDADPGLTDDPAELAEASRKHLRAKFLVTKVAVSGANFAIAETGTLGIVESEGNGRMCLTLPDTLITVMGIEKVLPAWSDLEVFLQLLPRSSTGERMNPYTSTWSGVTPGDGPQHFHLVLLDNGRTAALADELGRSALHCIRCSACLNVCPVFERVGGHAYGSVYPGPIGAVLSPLLTGMTGKHDPNDSLPYASSLCGACYDACPVKIDIPSLLLRLRNQHVELAGPRTVEAGVMRGMRWVMSSPKRFRLAGRASRLSRFAVRRGRPAVPMPGMLAGWTKTRDVPTMQGETFRDWWLRTHDEPGQS